MLKRWNRVCGLVLLGGVLAVCLAAKDPKDQGFAGKWVMDKKNSHGSEMLGDLRQDIKQNGSELTIQSRFPEPASGVAPLLYLGIMATAVSLKTDGQETINEIGPFKHISKTTLDGNKLTTEWNSTINGDAVQGKWVRTLASDGKHMTLEITESSTHGQKGDATLAFTRK